MLAGVNELLVAPFMRLPPEVDAVIFEYH